MTYDQERAETSQIALERAENRIWVLEQQVRERDALIDDYRRLLGLVTVYGVIVATLVAGWVIWKLLR